MRAAPDVGLSLAAMLAASLVLAPPAVVQAQTTDPAAAQIERFDDTLIQAMKLGPRAGVQARYRILEPAIVRTFDLPTMTRFAVGPTWSTIPPADQEALVRAFTRMTVATYAHNFSGYDGERFTLDPKVETRGADKLVRTQLIARGAAPTVLTYRLRQAGETWKVIDVYYNGAVSSLLSQRSEFAATLRTGGPAALVRRLTTRADTLLSTG